MQPTPPFPTLIRPEITTVIHRAMRGTHLPSAIAACTLLGLLPSSVGADDKVRRASEPPHPQSTRQSADLLAGTGLGEEYRLTIDRLAPFLDPALFRSLDPHRRTLLLRYARQRFEHPSPVAPCWSPETPLEILIAYHAVEDAVRAQTPAPHKDGGEADPPPAPAKQFFRRWTHTATDGEGQGQQGTPVTLTWSIVPDGTPIPGDPTIGDPAGPSNLRARLAQIYGGDTGPPENQPWFGIFQAVFDNITAHTGLNYLYEPNDDAQPLGRNHSGQLGIRADIRLGGHPIDGNGLTVAYNFFPDDGDMVIDTNDNWFANTSNDSIRLRNTLEHEHGHGIGLQHVCPIDHTKLMEPFINTNFRGLQFDELFTLQRWYGDFYEHHSPARNNDSFAEAAALPVTPGTPFGVEWLSIDDVSDVDFFALPVPAGATLTARVTPSSISYPEAAQNANGTCSSSTPFDPSANHDLHLVLFGPNQIDLLASANDNPAGQPEEIADFTVAEEGVHYLRVSGGSAGDAQLYRLDIEASAPSLSLALHSTTIAAESFSPPNGVIEPGETIALDLALTNSGLLDASGLQATLSGPPGFTAFDVVRDYGLLAPAQVVTRTFLFALEGSCGETLALDLTVTDEGRFETIIPLEFTLGIITTVLHESFDSNGAGLPSVWSSATTGAGSGWSVNDIRAQSPPTSLHAETIDAVGTSDLLSPSLTLGSAGGSLSFRHFFDTEAGLEVGYDGGVLEVSLDGAPWQDILAAGATFAQGGYVLPLSSAFQSPLPGRLAWSGPSESWITTVVDLPPAFAHLPLRFRWRLAHDASIGASSGYEGWFLDDISVLSPVCDGGAAALTLTIDDDTASEFTPLDVARITFHTPLPPVAPLAIPLLNTGTATIGLDVIGLENLVLPAGQTSLEVIIQAVNDSEVEGDETLVLSIDPASGLVVEGAPTATIIILDTPYGQWAAATFGLATANGPLEDRDRDGALNLEEYASQTDGSSPSSFPHLAPRREGGSFRIDAPLANLPPDVYLSAETSTDLHSWTTSGIEFLADGFQVDTGDSERFLRLVYQLLPVAP